MRCFRRKKEVSVDLTCQQPLVISLCFVFPFVSAVFFHAHLRACKFFLCVCGTRSRLKFKLLGNFAVPLCSGAKIKFPQLPGLDEGLSSQPAKPHNECAHRAEQV
jgi:hypothetical protein